MLADAEPQPLLGAVDSLTLETLGRGTLWERLQLKEVAMLLAEILQDPGVQSKLSDTKAAGEVKALDQFYQVLQNEPSRAFYGTKHVERANEGQAIETLLISDKLFR